MILRKAKSGQDFYETVGRRIYRARTKLGLTQQALASLVALKRSSITNIEKGKQKFLVHTLADIAAALKVQPNDLLPSKNTLIEQELDSVIKDHQEREWIKRAMNVGHRRK